VSFWVGTEEYGGAATPDRGETTPAPDWRLKAIAATDRPRSLSVSEDRRLLAFVQDRGDTSDVHVLDLDESLPRRLTTGHVPTPYWEDAAPRLSPDGLMLAYVDEGRVWLVSASGGAPSALVDSADIAWGGPEWVSDERLVVPVEDGEYTRLVVMHVRDGTRVRLSREHGALDERGDETEAEPSPDGEYVAYTFTPRSDLNRSEIRVADLETGVVRALTGTPRMHDQRIGQVPEYTAEAIERAREPGLALTREAGREEHQRPREFTGGRHLDCDVGTEAVADDGVASEIGGQFSRELRVALHAHVLGRGGPAESGQRGRNEADRRLAHARLRKKVVVEGRRAERSGKQKDGVICSIGP
jgi:hypothetical protein